MSNEMFCLRWNDFERNIICSFKEIRDDSSFFDVTLACDNEQIQAHKVILSACSPLFRDILLRNPHQHPLVYLKGVKYTDLQSLLDFMYHGEVNVAQEQLNSFLAVAEEFKIKGLTQKQSNNSHQTSTASQPKSSFQNPVSVTKSSIEEEEDDIQEVVPVKSEPRDPQTQQVSPENDYHSQETHALTTVDDQSLSYQDEDYNYQEEDASLEGPIVEVIGADGYKGPMDPLGMNMDMDSLISDTGNGTMCLLCHKVLAYRHDAKRHIRMKHSGNNAEVTCDLCGTKSKHRWSHADHMRQKHGQYCKPKQNKLLFRLQ